MTTVDVEHVYILWRLCDTAGPGPWNYGKAVPAWLDSNDLMLQREHIRRLADVPDVANVQTMVVTQLQAHRLGF